MANPKIQLRHDNPSNWSTINPVLAEGEVGVELTSELSNLLDVEERDNMPLTITKQGVLSGFYNQSGVGGDQKGGYLTFHEHFTGDYTVEITFDISQVKINEDQNIIHYEKGFTVAVNPEGNLVTYNFTTGSSVTLQEDFPFNEKHTVKVIGSNSGKHKVFYLDGVEKAVMDDNNVDLTDTYPNIGVSSFGNNGVRGGAATYAKIYLKESNYNGTVLYNYNNQFKIGDGGTNWNDLTYQKTDVEDIENSIEQLEQDYGSLVGKVNQIENEIPEGYLGINPITIIEGARPYQTTTNDMYYSPDKKYVYDLIKAIAPKEGFSSNGFTARLGVNNFVGNPARIYIYFPSPELFIGFDTQGKITFGSQRISTVGWFTPTNKAYGYEMILDTQSKTLTCNTYQDKNFTKMLTTAKVKITNNDLNTYLTNYLQKNFSITWEFVSANNNNSIEIDTSTSGVWRYSTIQTPQDNIQLLYDNNTLKVNESGQLYADVSSEAPANMVTTDGVQTITGQKSFTNGLILDATSSDGCNIFYRTSDYLENVIRGTGNDFYIGTTKGNNYINSANPIQRFKNPGYATIIDTDNLAASIADIALVTNSSGVLYNDGFADFTIVGVDNTQASVDLGISKTGYYVNMLSSTPLQRNHTETIYDTSMKQHIGQQALPSVSSMQELTIPANNNYIENLPTTGGYLFINYTATQAGDYCAVSVCDMNDNFYYGDSHNAMIGTGENPSLFVPIAANCKVKLNYSTTTTINTLRFIPIQGS